MRRFFFTSQAWAVKMPDPRKGKSHSSDFAIRRTEPLPQARECRAAPSEPLNVATGDKEVPRSQKMSRCCPTLWPVGSPFCGALSAEHAKHA